jgi:hypothetical protein
LLKNAIRPQDIDPQGAGHIPPTDSLKQKDRTPGPFSLDNAIIHTVHTLDYLYLWIIGKYMPQSAAIKSPPIQRVEFDKRSHPSMAKGIKKTSTFYGKTLIARKLFPY